jgi:hypothetical protein
LAIAGIVVDMTMAMLKAKRGRGRPASTAKSIKTLGYWVTTDYLAWITRAAGANRSSVAGVIDQAAAKYVHEIGLDGPPTRTA